MNLFWLGFGLGVLSLAGAIVIILCGWIERELG
jgi:hypothetical protein